jgi:DNA ligase 1
VRLAALVAVSEVVASTSARNEKRDAIASLLQDLSPDEVAPAVGFLVGEPRQGRIGIGWATLRAVPTPATVTEPAIDVAELDDAISRLAATSGAGSGRARGDILGDLLARATPAEATFVRRLMTGELRQGALEGVMVTAIARAADVPDGRSC